MKRKHRYIIVILIYEYIMDNKNECPIEEVVDRIKNEDLEKRGRGKSISAAVLLGLARRKIETSRHQNEESKKDDNVIVEGNIKGTNNEVLYTINDSTIAKNPTKRRHTSFQTSQDNDEIYSLPFEKGWSRELVYRATTDGTGKRNADVYYKSPDNFKLRSIPNIYNYLEKAKTGLSIANFSFAKRTIYHPPQEIVRKAEARFAGNTTSVKSTPASSPKGLKIVIKKSLNKSAESKIAIGNRIDTGRQIARQLVKSTEARRRQEQLDLMQDVNEILQHTKPHLHTQTVESVNIKTPSAKSGSQAKKRKLLESNDVVILNNRDIVTPKVEKISLVKSNHTEKSCNSNSPNKPIISIIMEKAAKRKERREERLAVATRNKLSIHESADSSLQRLNSYIREEKIADIQVNRNNIGEAESPRSKAIRNLDSIKVMEVVSIDDDDDDNDVDTKNNLLRPLVAKLNADDTLEKSSTPDRSPSRVSTVKIERRKAARTAANLALRAYMDNALKSVEKPAMPISVSNSTPANHYPVIKKKTLAVRVPAKKALKSSLHHVSSGNSNDRTDSALSASIKKTRLIKSNTTYVGTMKIIKSSMNKSISNEAHHNNGSSCKRSKRISAIKLAREVISNTSGDDSIVMKSPSSAKKVRFSLDSQMVNKNADVKEIAPIVIQPDYVDDEDVEPANVSSSKQQLNTTPPQALLIQPLMVEQETTHESSVEPIIIEPAKTHITIITSKMATKKPELKKQAEKYSFDPKPIPPIKPGKSSFSKALNSVGQINANNFSLASDAIITSVDQKLPSKHKLKISTFPKPEKNIPLEKQKVGKRIFSILPKIQQLQQSQTKTFPSWKSQQPKPQPNAQQLSKPQKTVTQPKPQLFLKSQPQTKTQQSKPYQPSKQQVLPKRQSSMSNLMSSKDAAALKSKICDLTCAGMAGTTPSLYCDMCMAAYHPSCVGYFFLPSRASFTCWSCRSYAINAENIEYPLRSCKIQIAKLPDTTNVYTNDLINLQKLEPTPKPKDPSVDEGAPRTRLTVSHSLLASIDIKKPIMLKTKERSVMVAPNQLSVSRSGLHLYIGADEIEDEYIGGLSHLLIFKMHTSEEGDQVITVCSIEEQINEVHR